MSAGTITPLPQGGNPKPRVFRLPELRYIVFSTQFIVHVLPIRGELEQKRHAGSIMQPFAALQIILGGVICCHWQNISGPVSSV